MLMKRVNFYLAVQHSPFPPFTVQLDEYSSGGIPVLTGWKAVQPSPHIRPFSEVATPLIKYNGIPASGILLKHTPNPDFRVGSD